MGFTLGTCKPPPKTPQIIDDKIENKINVLNNYINNYECIPALEPYQTKRSTESALHYRQKKYRLQIADVMKKKMREIEDRLTIEKSGSGTHRSRMTTYRKNTSNVGDVSKFNSDFLVSHRSIDK